MELQVGPFAQGMGELLIAFTLTCAKMGHCVIVDDVSFGKEEVDRWRKALSDYSVLWVGIKVPLHVLEEIKLTVFI